MKAISLGLAAIAAFAALPAAATDYNVTFDTTSTVFGGPFQTVRSIFTTSDTAVQIGGQTAYAITGITGTINGVAITGLFDAPGNPTYYYFTTGPTFLDGSGVRFNAGSATNIAFFHQDNVAPDIYRINGNGTISAFGTATTSLATSAVPEPATWALMIVGFGIVGGALRRRQKAEASIRFA